MLNITIKSMVISGRGTYVDGMYPSVFRNTSKPKVEHGTHVPVEGVKVSQLI